MKVSDLYDDLYETTEKPIAERVCTELLRFARNDGSRARLWCPLMKLASRLLLAVVFLGVVGIAWYIVLGAESDEDRQRALSEPAEALLAQGIFISAVPYLEEAVGFNTAETPKIEELLKKVYLELQNQGNFRRRYLDLLDMQMRRDDAEAEVFLEAANFLIPGSRTTVLEIIQEGIRRTGSEELVDLFESIRYDRMRLSGGPFEEVTAIHALMIGYREGDLWGYANAGGDVRISARFDQISTFGGTNDGLRAVVRQGAEIFAIDNNGNRVALYSGGNISDFGNLANQRIPVKVDGEWRRANASFGIGAVSFEELGTYSGGYVAAKENGRWGVIGLGGLDDWLIPPAYDGIVMDDIGRSYGQGAVFVRQGSEVFMYSGGRRLEGSFEDAWPFGTENYAAVKRGGLWGFVDAAGQVIIPFQFEDAKSFGQLLAPVSVDGLWGFISLRGELVYAPEFLEAGVFSDGYAPVLTDRGWRFLTGSG